MDAILIADRTRPELAPLTDRTAAALLPIAAKPLIEHALDSLQAFELRRVFVVTSPFAEHVREALGSGRQWGMDFHFTTTCGDESTEQLLERFRERVAGTVLLVRADLLYGAAVGEFLREAADSPDVAACFATSRGRLLGLDLFRFDRAEGEVHSALLRARAVELPEVVFDGLDSLQAYHAANLRAVRDSAGLSLPELAARSGYRVGRRSRVSGGSRYSAGLDDEVVSDRVLADHGASLRRSVILPGTFVGEKVEGEGATAWGHGLIRLSSRNVPESGSALDSGNVSGASDSLPVAELETFPVVELLSETLNRLGGLLLLLLSLPLWPLFALLSCLANPRRPFRRERLVGNRMRPSRGGGLEPAIVSSWRGAVPIPWLCHLPRVVAVARGDLRLVGARPLSRRRRATLREEAEGARSRAGGADGTGLRAGERGERSGGSSRRGPVCADLKR